MATVRPEEKISPDVVRESLMEISRSVPDKLPVSDVLGKDLSNSRVVELKERDGEEEYRSKLISISYSESPDTKILPPSSENVTA